ncbi:hypothetical protein L7F22_058967 [Adiantum nelumboides]|nr:hypothetical protein [Adiantum nelumboides]
MEYATSLDDEDDIYRRDARQSRMGHGQAIQLLQIDILQQSLPPGLESETSRDYVLPDRIQSLVHTDNCRHFEGWEGGSLPRDGEHVLPLIIDGCLMTGVRDVIYRLEKLARWITSKEIDISSIAQKKRECIELLCLMEKELPTSFFDIQVHVLIHLVDEIEIAGVISTRWMFWVERFMGVLKGLVRQRARPEGSMSEGWVLGECMYYLAEYFERIDEGAPCKWTLDEPTILSDEILCGKGIWFKVSYEERTNLCTFVIYNSQCMEKFVEEYHEVISNAQRRQRGGKSSKTEPLSILGWLSHHIKDGIIKGEVISDEQREIGLGCDREVVLKVDWFCADYKGPRATMRQECSGFWSMDSSKPLRVTREPYILLAHCEQAFFYAAPDSNSPWREVVPINSQGCRIFDTTYMEVDQDSLHEDESTSTKPLQHTTLAQEEPQEEAVDNNDAVDAETEDLAREFDFEPHHLEEQPSIDVPPTLALDVHLTTEELQETIQDNEEIELIIDLFSMNE